MRYGSRLPLLLIAGSMAVMSAHGVDAASICFVESDETGSTAKLYRIDPANPTPWLLLDMSQEVFGMIRDPEFSPNGQWIAFSCEKDLMSTPWRSNLWIIDRNGQGMYSVTHLTPGSFPQGSPTGAVEGIVYEDGLAKSGAWVYISSFVEGATADVNGYYRFDNVPIGSQYVTAYDSNILYDEEDFGFSPVEVVEGLTSPGEVTLVWDWDLQQGVTDPTWAPAGREVLFLDNSGGSNRILTDGSGFDEVVPLPEGVSQFIDIAVRPTNGDIVYIADVWFGDESLKGIWISDAQGGGMRQIVSDDSYDQGSLHWSPDGTRFGYMTTVQNQQGDYVDGIMIYDDQGEYVSGIALDQGWYGEFGGWDPTQEYICVCMWPSGEFQQAVLYTVRLSDFSTVQLYGPGGVSYPSWGPEATGVFEAPWEQPSHVVLGPAFPNPSREKVTVRLSHSRAGAEPVRLGVFDLAGRRVVSMPAMEEVITWNGCDGNGRPVPAGTYIMKAIGMHTSPSLTKIVILR